MLQCVLPNKEAAKAVKVLKLADLEMSAVKGRKFLVGELFVSHDWNVFLCPLTPSVRH